ncbi:Major facilitator superfamily domain- general substrate transporter [Apiospora arundinis]
MFISAAPLQYICRFFSVSGSSFLSLGLNLAGGLLVHDAGGLGGTAGAHDGVLAGHATVEGALELGAEGQLGHVGRLLLRELDTLLREGLVLHTVEASSNLLDLSLGAVRRPHRRGYRGGLHAVLAEANRGSGRRVDLFAGEKKRAPFRLAGRSVSNLFVLFVSLGAGPSCYTDKWAGGCV